MLETLQNKTAYLFVAAFAFSFLFIPAFQYGAASVWAILFAIIIAFYFDASLQRIIKKISLIENEGKRSFSVAGHYFLLVSKVAFFSLLVPYLSITNNVFLELAPSKLDQSIFVASPINLIFGKSYSGSSIETQFFIIINFVVFLFILLGFVYSFKKLWVLAKAFAYKGSFDLPGRKMNFVEYKEHDFYAGVTGTYLLLGPALFYYYLGNPAYDWGNVGMITILSSLMLFIWPGILSIAIVLSRKHY